MGSETTNPGIRFSDGPVMQDQCRERTAEIIKICTGISEDVNAFGSKLDVHVARHQGEENAASRWFKSIGISIGVLGCLTGLVMLALKLAGCG